MENKSSTDIVVVIVKNDLKNKIISGAILPTNIL
jgi:hypothetical protein